MTTAFKPGPARLGFGCAYLPGSLSRSDVLRLLETALDSAISHFDTAPLYGWGAAEALLGELASRRRDEMTIVTKAGIAPPDLAARALAKLSGGQANPRFGRFAPALVKASVDNSLRALRTEQVDALLLHEVKASEVSDDLLHVLQALKQSGQARAIGLATSASDTAAISAAHPGVFEIFQLPVEAAAPVGGALLIRHSVLGARLARASAGAGDRDGVAEILLRAAMAQNPAGVTLFSSTRVEAVRRNAALTVADTATASRAAELLGVS